MACSCKNKNQKRTAPTDECWVCIQKHYSLAVTLMREVGYEAVNTDLITGNLEAAALHCDRRQPGLAELLRSARHLWISRRYWEAVEKIRPISGRIHAELLRDQPIPETFCDVIIPFRHGGSKCDSEELRYALRSIAKNLSGFRNVFIVGAGIPDWVTGVKFIKYPNTGKNKQERINNALIAAMQHPDCGENVIFWADDNILLQQTPYPLLQGVWKGNLATVPAEGRWWNRTRHETAEALKRQDRGTVDFESHVPTLLNRTKYLNLQRIFDFNATEPGLCYLSVYANYYRVPLQFRQNDVKATVQGEYSPEKIRGKRFLGFDDKGVEAGIINFCREAFPDKCNFEK